jgi:hypothetical protein
MGTKSLKERLAKKREEIKKRSSSGSAGLIFIKEGTYRIRPLPVKEEEDWGWEITHFYLGPEIKGVISPASIGLPCPILEKHKALTESKNDADLELAKVLTPRKRYVVPVLLYKNEKGGEIDEENSGKLVLLTGKMYGQMIDFYLDSDLGDFCDPEEGYDLKIKRSGKSKTDTEYTVTAMRPSPIPSKWAKEVNLEEMVKAIIPSYDEAEEKLEQYLQGSTPDEEEAETERSAGKRRAKKHRKSEDE